MEKVLSILEKNVQWIVLALSVAFLGWVAYTYAVKPPATIKLGARTVVPADVDPAISVPATALSREIADTKAAVFPSPDLVTSWQTHMDAPYIALADGGPWNTVRKPEDFEIQTKNPNNVHVASLPILPKATPLAPITGLSVVQIQAPNNGNGNGNGNAAQPAAAPATEDLLWATAGFTIPGKLLSQAMLAPLKGQALDATLYNSALLQVVLQRQKSNGVDANGNPVFPDGDKGVEEIPPLRIYQADLQPLPQGDDIKAKYDFLVWAQQNVTEIVNPVFYPVSAGTPWAAPQTPALGQPAGGATQPATQPAAAPTAPAAPPAAPPAGGLKASAGTVGSRANASYSPLDAGRPPGAPWAGNIRDVPSSGGGNFGGQSGGNGSQVNPFANQDDIQIWAHDETVKPGQSYRYRVIYRMKNPIFGLQNMAPDKLINQLAISSPPSDWSAPITVAEKTKYWLAQIPRLDKPVSMDIAHWKGGNWNLDKNILLSPGDGVPGTELTLVDLRMADAKSGRDKYVLLVSDTGDLTRRDLAGDVADADHQAMVNQAANPNGQGQAPDQPPAPRGRLLPGRGPNGIPGRE